MSLPSLTRKWVEGSSFPGVAGSGNCLTHTATFMTRLYPTGHPFHQPEAVGRVVASADDRTPGQTGKGGLEAVAPTRRGRPTDAGPVRGLPAGPPGRRPPGLAGRAAGVTVRRAGRRRGRCL